MRFVVFLCSLLLLSAAVQAQGFRSVNGRNHPELSWQVAETAHFRIVYPARLSGIEVEAAAVAEASYAALSANLGVTFDRKIRLYLSDEDEIANGFAMPLGNGFSNIWVHTNDVAAQWTGREKWLRKVIAHELAHIFHYQAVRSRIGLLSYLVARPVPSFWAEGLAQYQTERWDALRGDRWLRTAVLADRLDYKDGTSSWNGRLLYAVGNAQVRYFAEQYGDSTLARLFRQRKPLLFGLARVHDFPHAFEATTGQSYRTFYDDWRRHVNVLYNTLAGQMETVDSLAGERLGLPGQYIYDVAASPDGRRLAVVALASLDRPIRQLYVVDAADSTQAPKVVAEGGLQTPVSWSPDGRRLAYARRVRDDVGGLVYDLFVVDADGGGQRRLTRGRRAVSPSFAPDGRRLAFVGVADGTANVFVLDLETGLESRHTPFVGDVQISSLTWRPGADQIAFAAFDADGERRIHLLDLTSDVPPRPLTPPGSDARQPVWSPDGRRLAYTSLEDDVPNVFILPLRADQLASTAPQPPDEPTPRRITRLVTGAEVLDWPSAPDGGSPDRLAVSVMTDKTGDAVYAIPADRQPKGRPAEAPSGYGSWRYERPPQEVPPYVDPDPTLIQGRYPYVSWDNLTHVFSAAVPFYNGPENWGIAGGTAWVEPLGKHMLVLYAGLSMRLPGVNSSFILSYVNNQLSPTILLQGYRFPASARVYGTGLLVERISGLALAGYWPIDWTDTPYLSTRFGLKFRYSYIEPLRVDPLDEYPDDLEPPETSHLRGATVLLRLRKRRPYRHNNIHPLDGYGAQMKLVLTSRGTGTSTNAVRPDLTAYRVFPGPGQTRFWGYLRAQVQFGETIAQDFVGFSRYDSYSIDPPVVSTLRLGSSERVRGYRTFVLGRHMLFGSLEYRVPVLPDLKTRLLGLVGFGYTSFTAFADGGMVWLLEDTGGSARQLGLGLEVKNLLRLGGIDVLHSFGAAQPAAALGDRSVDFHYRVKAAYPF